jgi:hypothetical protein
MNGIIGVLKHFILFNPRVLSTTVLLIMVWRACMRGTQERPWAGITQTGTRGDINAARKELEHSNAARMLCSCCTGRSVQCRSILCT